MGKWKGEALIVLEMGGGEQKKRRLYFKSMLPSKQQISQLFPNKNHLDCPLNVWHETLTFSYLIQCLKAIRDNVFLCFPEVAN